MKHFIILMAVLMLGLTTYGGWFSKNDQQTEQRNRELQDQLRQQQDKTDTWRTTAFSLGVGCVVVLIIGTAIGSKGRRDAQRK
jgi:hypothetical protein